MQIVDNIKGSGELIRAKDLLLGGVALFGNEYYLRTSGGINGIVQ